ncbi:conjugal transfer protein TraF [Teredinibacter turnerae]|uniref:conjugal transfer protein TraF n=1 Tax=Teredinibacter turnerae TaxID=2426 RepID=UPI000368F769|nr:conjugal transfer protein TraF [Teredinibacter turnerae]
MFSRFSALLPLSLCTAGVMVASSAQAISYGIYDPRGLAMGGAGVGVASFHQAQYYNPALLALNDESENRTRDSRFVFPNLVVQVDDSVEAVIDAADDNLQENLERAVDGYNSSRSAEAAGEVANRARQLETLLVDLGNQQIEGEVVFGLSVSEPSKFEGGAFFISSRSISFADSTIPAADHALLADYINAMDVLAAGGSFADISPALLDGNGNLIDPSDRFNSSANITAFNLLEWGVSLSRKFEFFGQSVALGVTPKVLNIYAISDSTDFGDDELDFDDDEQSYLSVNGDVGVLFELFDHYRVGVAAKDLVPEKFTTNSGAELQLKTRSRLGLGYVRERFSLGLDMDLSENQPVAAEAPLQEVALGLEVTPLRGLDLRLGYRQDLSGNREDTLSGGLAYQIKRLVIELSYGQSDATTSGALQFGWRF